MISVYDGVKKSEDRRYGALLRFASNPVNTTFPLITPVDSTDLEEAFITMPSTIDIRSPEEVLHVLETDES